MWPHVALGERKFLMVHFGALIGGTVLGCALKLTTSVDDLIWFSPFLALCKDNAERVKCCIIYSFVCLIATFGAVAIAYLADVGFTAILNSSSSDNDYWDSARILSIVAAVAIGAYAAKEYREWIEEEDNKLPSFAEATTALKSCVAKVFNPAASYRPVGEDEDSVGSSSPRREPKSGSGDSIDAIGLEMEAIGDEEDEEEEGDFSGAAVAVGFGRGPQLMPSDDVDAFNEEAQADGTLPSPFQEINTSRLEGSTEDDTNGADQSRTDDGGLVAISEDDVETGEKKASQEELDEDELEIQKNIEEASKSSTRLFVVAFCGTLDDMTMFAAVILGKSIPYVSLVMGSMLATVIIIVACWQISLYKPFAECIQKIPMWALLTALSLYILIGGLAR